MMSNGSARAVDSITFETDRRGESVRVQKPRWLPGVSFWTISGSARRWAMHNDTFMASLVLGPTSMRTKWYSRGQEREAGPGDIQLTDPGEAFWTTGVSGPTDLFVSWWAPELLQETAKKLGASCEELHLGVSQLGRSFVADVLTRLHAALLSGADPATIDVLCRECTTLLVEQAMARSGRSHARARHPGVRRALSCLTARFASNVSLDELAAEAKVSKFHLSRCFREVTGVSPHQYQTLLRLQAARRMLENGHSVRETAELCGFADGAHLSRAFRAWLGISPSRWASTAPSTQRAPATTLAALSRLDTYGPTGRAPYQS
jgi:AraC-like DNA-binding protein